VLSGTVIAEESWKLQALCVSVILKRSSAFYGGRSDSGRGNGILQRTLGDNGVLDGERHKHQRQLLMPPFHGERCEPTVNYQITEQVTSQWQATQSFAVRPFMQEISLRVILRAVFGRAGATLHDQIKQLIGKFLDLTATRFGFTLALFPMLQIDLGSWSPGGRFNRLRQEIDDLLYAEIQAREHGTELISSPCWRHGMRQGTDEP